MELTIQYLSAPVRGTRKQAGRVKGHSSEPPARCSTEWGPSLASYGRNRNRNELLASWVRGGSERNNTPPTPPRPDRPSPERSTPSASEPETRRRWPSGPEERARTRGFSGSSRKGTYFQREYLPF